VTASTLSGGSTRERATRTPKAAPAGPTAYSLAPPETRVETPLLTAVEGTTVPPATQRTMPPTPRRPLAERNEKITPTAGLGALAGFVARSSGERRGPTLLDAFASRFIPGASNGATAPTLLLILQVALALALALPRAPRRIGRIIDATWRPLDGISTSTARPG
jgi:hypothetical protein